MKRALVLPLLALAAACGAGPASSGPSKVDLPVSDGVSAKRSRPEARREAPPPSGPARDVPFPAASKSRLANGLSVAVVKTGTIPLVHARLLVRAGANDGAAPGIGALTARMLRDGGTRGMRAADVLGRIEGLGADLSSSADLDATVLGLTLPKDKLGEGLALLSQVVRAPAFDPAETKRSKARLADELSDAFRSSGAFAGRWLVFRELYPAGSAYASLRMLPSQLATIQVAQLRDFHRRFYVPKAATLVLAGDVDEATGKELAEKHFAGWTGGEPPAAPRAAPKLPDRTRVLVAHRPKSTQSDVFAAVLAPPRVSEGWARVRVANQVFGGGVASRLFTDVREQRSLAYSTFSQVAEVARGEQPLLVYAGTQTPKTSEAVTALLENLDRMKASPPTQAETESARRFASDTFAIAMETTGAIAELVVAAEKLGLAEGYWDAYRKQLRAVSAEAAAAAAEKLFGPPNRLIVVVGDADVVAADLARFGEVVVVDPEKELKPMKTIPAEAK